MKFFATIAPKRVTNFALALMLVFSTLAASVPFIFTPSASALATPYTEGFEYGSTDWTNTVIASNGADGITASNGTHFGQAAYNAYTKWGNEYRSTFPAGGYSTQLDMFFDPSWAASNAGQFDFSSAINGQDGNHLRDFIFSFGAEGNGDATWYVNAGNNAPGNPTGVGRAELTETGWYTIKHDFRNVGGVLAVTMTITNKATGDVIKTWTLSNPSDLIATVVGGNRYGWFPTQQFDFDHIAIDNATLTLNNAPQPTAPQNGGTTLSPTKSVTFGWDAVTDAASYEVRYSQGPSRTPNNVDGELTSAPGTILTNSNSVTQANLPTGTLFWQVRGIFDGVAGPWSNIWSTNLVYNVSETVVVQPDDLHDWTLSGTGGGTSFLALSTGAPAGNGALKLLTNSDNQARANATRTETALLSELNNLSYTTKQNAGIPEANAAYRISIDADGNSATTTDRATLVYEPYWQNGGIGDAAPVVNGVWQTWDVTPGLFWASISGGNSIAGLTNGAGGAPFYTLADVTALYPNARVTAVSVGIGSYNPSWNIEVDNFVYGTKNANSIITTTYDFESDTTAPTGLSNATPFDGAFTTTANQTQMTWNAATDNSGDAVGYFYESSTSNATNPDGSFVTPVYQSGMLSTTFINTPNTPAGVYYWHVRAVDTSGNTTAWTTPWTVTVDNTAPTAPTLSVTGLNSGDATNSSSIEATWTTPTPDTIKYDYKYWNDIAGDPYNTEASAWIASGVTGNSRSGSFTQGEGTHFIQVRAIDAAGNVSPWSNTFTVVYDITDPTVTIDSFTAVGNVISPTVTTNGVTYSWVADNASSAANVTISDPAVKEPTFTVNVDGTYSFTVTVTDEAGNTASDTFSFTYTTPAPVVAPSDNQGNGQGDGQPAAFTGVFGNGGAVLGATTDTTTTDNAANNGAADVEGASIDKTATVDTDATDGSIFGLAWYWWILILAALAAIIAWIVAAIRRRNEAQS